ncbi:class I SAM-dependent methyltransferase [Patescibacteria group bacterium]|nr:class I SAM-dependent methyltransferase [Patescibacteria group bacterium]
MEKALITEKSNEYELLDSGMGEKLERYGKVVLSRPDPQALWTKSLSEEEWKKADATYSHDGTTGKWQIKGQIPDPWTVTLEEETFSLKLLPSKHLGIFPEQGTQWKWLKEKIKKEIQTGREISVLNLFAYTGGASIACASAGANVCHVDASKFPVDYAHTNLELSGLADKPVRFIVDDARKFLEREIKRGNKYDVVIMDPPVYGKGTNEQIWKIEEDLLPLIGRVKNILSDKPVAIVLNGYASVYSHVTYAQILGTITKDLKGEIVSGGFFIKESKAGRLLPCGIYARFESN